MQLDCQPNILAKGDCDGRDQDLLNVSLCVKYGAWEALPPLRWKCSSLNQIVACSHSYLIVTFSAGRSNFLFKKSEHQQINLTWRYEQGTVMFPGELSWPLGAQELPYPETLDKYRLFGQFLLQGKVTKLIGMALVQTVRPDVNFIILCWIQVIPELAQFAPHLLTPPLTMLKKWSKWVKIQSAVQWIILCNAIIAKCLSTRRLLPNCFCCGLCEVVIYKLRRSDQHVARP